MMIPAFRASALNSKVLALFLCLRKGNAAALRHCVALRADLESARWKTVTRVGETATECTAQ